VQDSELIEDQCRGEDTHRQLAPHMIERWDSPSSNPVQMQANVVLGAPRMARSPSGRISPSEHGGFAHIAVSCDPALSNITAWDSNGEEITSRRWTSAFQGADRWVNLDLRLDITQPVGRTFARKFAKLVNEFRIKEEA